MKVKNASSIIGWPYTSSVRTRAIPLCRPKTRCLFVRPPPLIFTLARLFSFLSGYEPEKNTHTLCKKKVNASPLSYARSPTNGVCLSIRPPLISTLVGLFLSLPGYKLKIRKKITSCKKKFNAHTLISPHSHIHTHVLIHMLSIFIFILERKQYIVLFQSTRNATFMVSLTDTLLSAPFFYW